MRDEKEPEEIKAMASMVVDLEVKGLSNNTETNVYFDLYKNAVYTISNSNSISMLCFDAMV